MNYERYMAIQGALGSIRACYLGAAINLSASLNELKDGLDASRERIPYEMIEKLILETLDHLGGIPKKIMCIEAEINMEQKFQRLIKHETEFTANVRQKD